MRRKGALSEVLEVALSVDHPYLNLETHRHMRRKGALSEVLEVALIDHQSDRTSSHEDHERVTQI